MKALVSTLVLCALLALAGCGGSGDSSSTTESSGPTTTDSTSPESTTAGKEKTKPKVTVPKGEPPKKLVVEEIEEGTGATAKAGDQVTVQYVGVDY